MKYMIIKLLVFLLPFLLTTSPILSSSESEARILGDIFVELGISIEGVEDFTIQKDILRQGGDNAFWTIIAQGDGRVIKIEAITNINPDSAQRYIGEKQSMIDSLYKRIPSPYPGMVSKIIECPDQFKPKTENIEVEGEEICVYLLSSTPRFTYGASVEELIKYRGALAHIYRKTKKTLYQIEIFIPKQSFNEKAVLTLLSSLKFIRQAGAEQEKPATAQNDRRQFKDYNLMIIGFDPLGASHVGAYGYFRNTTPNLDHFAKKAFLFKNAVSPSSWTLPVFMSWFTSLYPHQHKIINKYSTFTEKEQILSNLSELAPSVVTLAQILKNNGYATAGFTGDAGVGGDFGYRLGFDVYYDETAFAGFGIVLPRALEWLKDYKEERFFLFIQAYDVHGCHEGSSYDFKGMFVDSEYKGRFKGTVEEYWELRNLSLEQDYLDMAVEDVDFWRSWYDEKIYEADKKLGRFLEEFDQLGLIERTIIIISSASGNEFYEHKRFDHGYSLYQELIHVPLIIKIPGEAGRTIEKQVRTIDIMPTVLEIMNVNYDPPVERQMQGVSLVSLIKGKGLQLDAFSETDYLLHVFKRSLKTSNGWKYIYSMDTGQTELYDLKNDPQELNNLVEEEKRIAYELEQKLFKHLETTN